MFEYFSSSNGCEEKATLDIHNLLYIPVIFEIHCVIQSSDIMKTSLKNAIVYIRILLQTRETPRAANLPPRNFEYL